MMMYTICIEDTYARGKSIKVLFSHAVEFFGITEIKEELRGMKEL